MSLTLKKLNNTPRCIEVYKKDKQLCTITIDKRIHFENADIEEAYINDIILIRDNFLLFYNNIYENNSSNQ